MKTLYIILMLLFSNTLFSQTIPLAGEWDFAIDTAASFDISSINKLEWRKAKVPLSWQAQFEDLRDYQGVGWYRKTFNYPSDKNSKNQVSVFDKSVLIKFNAVDYLAKVYINGSFAGEHEGGYTPFILDISKFIKSNENEVVVRVLDPLNEDRPTEGIRYYEIPHGKQTWYVQTSGIWQDVNIITKPLLYFNQVHITPSILKKTSDWGTVKLTAWLNESIDRKVRVRYKVIDPKGKTAAENSKDISAEKGVLEINFDVKDPLLWDIDSPNLYTLKLSLSEDNSGDKFIDKFGFRKFEAKDKKLFLNDKPFYLIAALDQDFYPETIYTTPSEEYIRDEMIKAKKLGLNMLRCHIKAPDPVYLKAADEVGLLVWYEIPNWDVFSFEAAARGSKTMDEMLARDWNHASLVILSIINESWGIDLQKKEQRDWLIKEYDRLKEKAAGRLVVDNSACWGNFHLKTDINDYHTYYAIPENRKSFDETVEEVSKRAEWLFSKFGDSHETKNEPLLISEFGNWGLPQLPSKLPFWMKRQFLDIDVSLPDMYDKRFKDYKYDRIFKDFNDLAKESQRSQFRSLKYEIESIRLKPEIQGYVITEFTDINWECNGLLDMWRNYKIYSDELPMIQQQDIIITRPVKYSYWIGEEAEIKTAISHYSNKDLRDLKLTWNSEDGQKGSIPIKEIKRAEVFEISPVKISLKDLKKTKKLRIDFQLLDNKENLIAKSFTEIFVFSKPENEIPISIYGTPRPDAGFTIKDKSNILVTVILDDKIISELSNGAYVICLVDSNTVFPSSMPLKNVSRNEGWLEGNWASNLNWMDDDNPLFKDISFGKSFGFETADCSPNRALTDIPSEYFSDVLSGLFIGWIHLSSGYIVQMKAGKGKLILCTFPLAERFASDPFAYKLLNNLVEYISSDDCNPEFTWSIK